MRKGGAFTMLRFFYEHWIMIDNEIQLTVIDRDDKEHVINAPTDMNLNIMEICKASDLPIEGTCGGMALCASCHVYVLSDHELQQPSEDEEDMLDQAFFVEPNSRLCCQIRIQDQIDGIKVKLAPVS